MVVTPECVLCACVQGTTPADEPCFPTWQVWIPFMILDITTDAVAIAITKHYSAATSVVVSALILPVQTILFQVCRRRAARWAALL